MTTKFNSKIFDYKGKNLCFQVMENVNKEKPLNNVSGYFVMLIKSFLKITKKLKILRSFEDFLFPNKVINHILVG